MQSEQWVEAAVTAARRARREGRTVEERAHWEEAWRRCEALPASAPLRTIVTWKQARQAARLDQDPLPLLERLDDADLLLHYEGALRGASRVARHHQDHVGYGDPRVHRLWSCLAAHHLERGDRVGWARARLELAWDAACTGQLTRLDELVDEVERADVDAVAVDTWHTCLRAASWAGDRRRGEEAAGMLEQLIDPTTVTAVVREALLEHAVLNGLERPPPYPAEDPFRRAYQDVLRHGRDGASAMLLGRSHGPEWALAVWNAARHAGQQPPGGEDLIRSSGCAVFRR